LNNFFTVRHISNLIIVFSIKFYKRTFTKEKILYLLGKNLPFNLALSSQQNLGQKFPGVRQQHAQPE